MILWWPGVELYLTDHPRKKFGKVVVNQSFKLPGFYRKWRHDGPHHPDKQSDCEKPKLTPPSWNRHYFEKCRPLFIGTVYSVGRSPTKDFRKAKLSERGTKCREEKMSLFLLLWHLCRPQTVGPTNSGRHFSKSWRFQTIDRIRSQMNAYIWFANEVLTTQRNTRMQF